MTRDRDKRRMAAIVVGNIFEWYDFALYGFFAGTIAKQFFPAGDGDAAVLATAATFGVAFLMRPLGALVFGLVADRRGRKLALSGTILLMALGTALIAAAPPHASWGLAATAMLVLGRLIQGFSAAGEAGVAMALLVESTPPAKRGVAGGWLGVGIYGAIVLGSLAGLAVTSLLSQADAQAWGWRIPFLLGLSIVPIGLYMRRSLSESAEFLSIRGRAVPPAEHAATSTWKGIFSVIGLAGFGSSVVYLLLVFMPGYAVRELALPERTAMTSTFVASLLLVSLLVPTGWFSDRLGRKPMILGSSLLGGAVVIPLFAYVHRAPSLSSLLLLQSVLAACLAAYVSSTMAMMASLFPVRRRALGIGIGYNFGVLVFGAFAPFITTWLSGVTADELVTAYYVAAGALVTVLVSLRLPEPCREEAVSSAPLLGNV